MLTHSCGVNMQVIFSPFDQRVESWRTPTQQFVEKIHKDSTDALCESNQIQFESSVSECIIEM
jgi:hypothetical protein